MVAAGVTVTKALADLPSAEAVTVAVPTAAEIRRPSAVMATTEGLLDDQVILAPMYFTPRLSVATPSSRIVSPTGITTVSGSITRSATSLGPIRVSVVQAKITGVAIATRKGMRRRVAITGWIRSATSRFAGRMWQRSYGADPGTSPAPRNA